jgi:filamentous hemagglutinin family protein
MEVAPNKVPIVNITTPSGAGVSHNRFKSLSIDPDGMIFNNSRSFGTSQLGGVILANPNLKNSATARIILNEVTGADISQLRGFAEIFGDRAQFVLANPNGVTCNGCGFIKTSRTTLTTGTPNLLNGDLVELDVDGCMK